MPFFAAFLFWLRFEDRPKADREVTGQTSEVTCLGTEVNDHISIRNSQSAIRNQKRGLIALSIAIPALLLLLPIRLFEVANPDWRPLDWVHAGAVVVVTLTYIWYVGGSAWLRHFAFPVLFVLVAVPWVSPIEQPIVQGLMRIVASIAAEAVNLCGIPAQVEGSVIRVTSGLVGVSEACSGVRSLQTSLMIGLLFGELKRLPGGRRLLLVFAALLVAFVANVGRAFFLVWIAASNNTAAVSRWHDLAGYTIVALVFVATLLLASLLAKRKVESRTAKVEKASNETDQNISTSQLRSISQLLHSSYHLPSSTFYFLLSTFLWFLLVEAGVEAWYRVHEQNLLHTAQWSVRWPENKQGFRSIPVEDQVHVTLRYDEGREGSWPITFDQPTNGAPTGSCMLFFFRWQPGTASILRARAHRPDACLPNTAWYQIADSGVRSYPVTEKFSLPFRHFEFARDSAPGPHRIFSHAFFCLREDWIRPHDTLTQQTSAKVQKWHATDRVRAVREGMRNLGQQVMEVVFVSPQRVGSEEAESRFSALIREVVVVENKS